MQTDIVHVYVKFQDTWSFAYSSIIRTVSEDTFEKMIKSIGTSFDRFDKVNHIHENLKVLEVRRATDQDYIETGTKQFTNESK